MMMCDDYQLNISRLVDGELPAGRSADTFLHLSVCPDCREFYDSLQRMNTAMAKASIAGEPESTLHHGVHAGAPDRRAMPRTRWTGRRIEVRLPVALASLFLAGVLAFAAARMIPWSAPETIYVTKLPAIIVTSETQTTHHIN